VLRADGTEVVPLTYTNALGLISYGASDLITQNSVKVIRWKRTAGVEAYSELGPFTVRLNMDGNVLPQYLPREIVFVWPRTTDAFGDTLLPVYDGIPMVPVGGTGGGGGGIEEWRPAYA